MSPEEPHSLKRLACGLLLVNLISALLFIALVNRPVFDDLNNLPDVSRYAHSGVSAATVAAHHNPAGPGSFVWMAGFLRGTGGKRVTGREAGGLPELGIAGSGNSGRVRARGVSESVAGRSGIHPGVSPYFLTAMGTVLTEGPALLFATSGALLWLEIFRRETVGGRGVAAAMAAGLCMGLAAVSRQYYLALFAAAGCFIVMQWRRGKTNASQRTLASLSLLVGCLPVILLWSIWKGLSSPGMVKAGLPTRCGRRMSA